MAYVGAKTRPTDVEGDELVGDVADGVIDGVGAYAQVMRTGAMINHHRRLRHGFREKGLDS